MSVVKVILWQNGQVMSFDKNGKQVPEYQGDKEEILPKLEKDFPHVKIENKVWNHG